MKLKPNTVLVGDALDTLRKLPPASVDCVITSPPYWALRNYGMDRQIGLEASVAGWVEHLSAVMNEVARVLTPTGCLWLNLGDTYSRAFSHGAPPKGLVLAPERLLLVLAEHGWTVRNKVVWSKPNATPSSVLDRLNCSWEPLYLLVRSHHYYFDLDIIRTAHRSRRTAKKLPAEQRGRPAWAGPLAGDQAGLERLRAAGLPGHPLGKNPGDVWVLPTSNYRGGHHATFPERLVEPPLLATCPERVCRACNTAWQRQPVERALGRLAVLGTLKPACDCQAAWRPGIVLDPFMGSGTTAVVAERLGRNWLGIELNPDFAALARRRTKERRNAA